MFFEYESTKFFFFVVPIVLQVQLGIFWIGGQVLKSKPFLVFKNVFAREFNHFSVVLYSEKVEGFSIEFVFTIKFSTSLLALSAEIGFVCERGVSIFLKRFWKYNFLFRVQTEKQNNLFT